MPPRSNYFAVRAATSCLVAALVFGATSAGAQVAPVPTAPPPNFAVPGPASAPAAAAAAVRAKVTETLLYQIPPGAKVADTLCSPDGRHVGCVENAGGKYAVVVDGARSPPLEWVVGRSLTFSQDGGRFAFLTQRDGLMFVVVGQAGGAGWSAAEQQPGGYLVGRVVLSPDGKRFAYGVQKEKGGKMVMVVDGAEHAPVDEIFAADMQFGPGGKRFGYRARIGKQVAYVVDGAVQPGADAVGGLTFSPDGGRYGYAAKVGAEVGVAVDGKPPARRYPFVGGLTFSPDGKKYAYVIEVPATAGATTAAGAATAPGRAATPAVPPVSPPASPPAAATKPVAKQQLVYNGGQGEQAFAPFDAIGAVAFSPDGRRLALTALAGRQWNVVVDGKIGPAYEGVGSMLLFSPDSKRLAVAAGRAGQQFLAVDGKESAPVDVVGPTTFSPDGQRVAYAVVAGQQRWLVLDDKRVGPATFSAFTPDSKHLGHAVPAPAAADRWTLAVDGQPVGGDFDGFPVGSKLVWDSPTVGRVIAGRATAMFAVKVELLP
jgi:hypothetical protein